MTSVCSVVRSEEMKPKTGVPKEQPPLPADIDDLRAFWLSVMKGAFTTVDEHDKLTNVMVPMELRLKASELLAKFTVVPAKKRAKTDEGITATPDILRLATLIEQSKEITNEALAGAINGQ